MQFKIEQNLLQVIANYLATRPWSEVNQLIIGIQNLEEIKDCEKCPKKEEKK